MRNARFRTALGVASLGAWAGLAALRGGFWRTSERLPRPDRAAPTTAAVAAVVPARDEQATLAATLPALTHQPLASVTVVDDESADDTASVAAAAGAQVVPGRRPPPGWAGKPWALAQGIEAVEPGKPTYYLLVDADVALAPGTVAALVGYAERERLDLVSVMARLDTSAGWARLLVPAFVYFFALLYPFRLVNRADSRVAAAAGGCVLISRSALERAGGIAAIHADLIDDVALAAQVKRSGGRIWLGLDAGVASVRRYDGLADLWRMVSRSAYVQLRHSPLLLAGTVAGLALLFVAPAVDGRPGAAAYAVMTATYLPTVRFYRLPPATALTLPLAGVLYTAMTVDSAIQHWRGRGAAWKGRSYAAIDSAGRRRRASRRSRARV